MNNSILHNHNNVNNVSAQSNSSINQYIFPNINIPINNRSVNNNIDVNDNINKISSNINDNSNQLICGSCNLTYSLDTCNVANCSKCQSMDTRDIRMAKRHKYTCNVCNNNLHTKINAIRL